MEKAGGKKRAGKGRCDCEATGSDQSSGSRGRSRQERGTQHSRAGSGARDATAQGTKEAGHSAAGAGGDFGEGQPASAYVRECPGEVPEVVKEMGLTRLIPLSVKERIWRQEYIDIFTLLEVR